MKVRFSAPILFLLFSALIVGFQLQAPQREVNEKALIASQAPTGDLIGSQYQFLIFETDGEPLPWPLLVQQEQNQMGQGQERGGQLGEAADQQNQQLRDEGGQPGGQQAGPEQQAQPSPAEGPYGGWAWAWWWWVIIAAIILFLIILFAAWGGRGGGGGDGMGTPPEDRL